MKIFYASFIVFALLFTGCIAPVDRTSIPQSNQINADLTKDDISNDFLLCSAETAMDWAIYTKDTSLIRNQINSVCAPQEKALMNYYFAKHGYRGAAVIAQFANKSAEGIIDATLTRLKGQEAAEDHFRDCVVINSWEYISANNPSSQAEVRRIISNNTSLCYGKHLKALFERKDNGYATARRAKYIGIMTNANMESFMSMLRNAANKAAKEQQQAPPPSATPVAPQKPEAPSFAI